MASGETSWYILVHGTNKNNKVDLQCKREKNLVNNFKKYTCSNSCLTLFSNPFLASAACCA